MCINTVLNNKYSVYKPFLKINAIFTLFNNENKNQENRIKTSAGDLSITTLQNCHSNFETKIIRKRETMLANQFEEKGSIIKC